MFKLIENWEIKPKINKKKFNFLFKTLKPVSAYFVKAKLFEA